MKILRKWTHLKQVESWLWKVKVTKVEKEDKRFDNQRLSWQPSKPSWTVFLYGMLIAGAGALILVLSLWLRERGLRSGDSTCTWKSKISIFLQFCLEVVLVSLGSFASSICCRKCYHIPSTPNCTSQWRSGNLTGHAGQSKWSIKPVSLSFAESYVFLLLIGCLSVALCFLFLFRKIAERNFIIY